MLKKCTHVDWGKYFLYRNVDKIVRLLKLNVKIFVWTDVENIFKAISTVTELLFYLLVISVYDSGGWNKVIHRSSSFVENKKTTRANGAMIAIMLHKVELKSRKTVVVVYWIACYESNKQHCVCSPAIVSLSTVLAPVTYILWFSLIMNLLSIYWRFVA